MTNWNISLTPLTTDTLPTFKSLLGSPDFGGCFCAVWTSFDETWIARCHDPAQPNYEITRRDITAGRQAGYFVYNNDALIGWTGAGPKTEFSLMKERLGSRLSPWIASTWVIGCIALKSPYRGQGLSRYIVQTVIETAQDAGANYVEAYPTQPWDEPRSYRGAYSMYARLGFEEVGRERDGDSEIVLMQVALLT